jgi:hypothetical protein
LKEFFCPWSNGAIHPVARPAFLRAVETSPLNFKILADQFVQIDTPRYYVPSNHPGRAIMNLKRAAEFIEDFKGKKRDLSFVIVFEIEVTIAANAAPGDTFDHRDLDRRIRVGFEIVVADKIVPRRNVKMTDFHRVYDTIRPAQ